jgi:hypothetical protein
MSRLPRWFVTSCAPQPTPEERELWLAHWRALDQAGKAEAEAALGWTLVDWLIAMGPETRAWWWWAADDRNGTLHVTVDGWPAPLASAEWMLRAAGGTDVTTSTT